MEFSQGRKGVINRTASRVCITNQDIRATIFRMVDQVCPEKKGTAPYQKRQANIGRRHINETDGEEAKEQRGNGRTAGDREPGRLREGLKRGKGKRERDRGDQNHHRTVKIVN